ncbi:MAG: hypothetical protein WKF68_11505 [Daejeonella sp.]
MIPLSGWFIRKSFNQMVDRGDLRRGYFDAPSLQVWPFLPIQACPRDPGLLHVVSDLPILPEMGARIQ